MAPASQRRKKDGKRHTKTTQGNEAEILATREKARDSVKDSKERRRASTTTTSGRRPVKAVSCSGTHKRSIEGAMGGDETTSRYKSSRVETEEEELDRLLDPDPRVRELAERTRAAMTLTNAAFVTPRHVRAPVDLLNTENEEVIEGNQAMEPMSTMEALQAALDRTTARLRQAEKQVRVISKTKLADVFQEGRVRSWSKEILWKQLKFITNDAIMNQAMRKAAKHFKVPEEEKGHWMSTYAHIVRDGLNQKRNACSQAMRKALLSK